MKPLAMFRPLCALCATVLLAACAGQTPPAPLPVPTPPAPLHEPVAASPQDWRKPSFLYATNRNALPGRNGSAQFGGLRSRAMSYGELKTTAGGGQADGSDLYRVNVALDRVTRLGQAGFFSEVERAAARTPGREVLLFIHGFDNTFEDAAKTAARVSIGIGFTGATVLYSWPSEGSPAAYLADRNNAYFAVHALKGLLRELVASPWVGRVGVVVHSMGNEAFIRAYTELAGECRGEADACAALRKVRTIVLAAPDVDREIFLDQHAARLTGLGARVVLYCSRGDVALAASALMQGGDYERLGKNVMCIPGIQVTDVSEVKTDVLGHSWISQSRAVLKDLRCALTEGCDRFGAGLLREMSCLPAMQPPGVAAGRSYWKLIAPGGGTGAPATAGFGFSLPSFLTQ
ncbi:Esterase/lipase superfamily enzyme [Humidesulfovibrio mexicanus]|uniref:Esterase/lipase superfamily enzyme n=1 Tax=Humidesulfovibrio mexicanus TaxID=147047 RepID=A0A239BYQ0_9BACT|nr:alpha/beta hydrolase [Humidesulfovibrio mexicanus]SNS12779.1 Esterase/lipase superfamily enzyme [Humidesulfovibrio mexicanus]